MAKRRRIDISGMLEATRKFTTSLIGLRNAIEELPPMIKWEIGRRTE